MLRHIVVFIYIFGSFLGMTSIFLYWLMSKKKVLKNATERVRLRKFMVSTFLIGLISFFTFYSQYIIFLQPSNTAFRILDYLFWVCFIFYWIDYLDSIVNGVFLRKIKTIIKYGCFGYILIWLFTTSHIWDLNFYISSVSSRMLFVMLDILFCMLSLFVVAIYVFRGQSQVESRLSGFYIFAVSIALMVYSTWEFLHYIQLFSVLSTPKAWELDPFNATAFFLLFTNLITLIYVYHKDFAVIFLVDSENSEAAVADNSVQSITMKENIAEINSINEATTIQSTTSEDIAIERSLTPREKEVMEFVYKGFNNAEIADELYISQNTVKHHIYNLFKKLEVNNRIELICLLQEYYS